MLQWWQKCIWDHPVGCQGHSNGLGGPKDPKSWSNEKMLLTKIVRYASVMKIITTTLWVDPQRSPGRATGIFQKNEPTSEYFLVTLYFEALWCSKRCPIFFKNYSLVQMRNLSFKSLMVFRKCVSTLVQSTKTQLKTCWHLAYKVFRRILTSKNF